MRDRVCYFSNNDHADWWMRTHCDRCRHDSDNCEPMGEMLFGTPTPLVTIGDDGHPICHQFTDATPTPAEVLAEWGQVEPAPSAPTPPVLPGQIDIFGNEVV